MRIIPHNKPSLGIEEIQAVTDVISASWIAQGEKTIEFENSVSSFLGFSKDNSAAVSNGTTAIYLVLKALNLEKKSEVILPSYVCSALLNAIYMANLIPILVDVNEVDFNISFEAVEENISANTKVIILPHAYGMPANISEFIKLRDSGIFILEDCATAIGSKINNQYVGTWGDATIFSFYASKFITCGTGGMIVSKNEKLIASIKAYLSFDGVTCYKPRFNFQFSDLQATMGIAQLSKISFFLKRRENFAKQYRTLSDKKGWEYQRPVAEGVSPNYYRFVLKLPHKEIVFLKDYLRAKGIKTIVPIENFELLHNYLKLDENRFPISEKLSNETLSLPIYPKLTDSEFEYIIEKIKEF